ncbi:nuclear transport factor 2 family protein [Muricauda oceani]|uniref:Nuclear transport factor 2 family protein n=1 Tax=Flagellimonas oceani TaxID=2698672 RepID=A0A6G7IZX8_9FLAO|nr:nuclear transport factor 2 family protein [Allomuricauda oceani]MBW8243701.1 nuclear transport factor 2 family protein [Allomuricauda oceani]QII43939.1 nuclear transport factor 2 family protein [Allomuricauda oceani]
MKTSLETIELFLAHTTNPDVIASIVDPKATYISLNFNNPELKKILPWTGTHHQGAKGFIDTFAGVNELWSILGFEVQDLFSEDEKVAVFGSFTYVLKTLDKQVTSPFSLLAKVKDEKVYHFMFMEDTFATSGTYILTPAGTFHNDPNETEFSL